MTDVTLNEGQAYEIHYDQNAEQIKDKFTNGTHVAVDVSIVLKSDTDVVTQSYHIEVADPDTQKLNKHLTASRGLLVYACVDR